MRLRSAMRNRGLALLLGGALGLSAPARGQQAPIAVDGSVGPLVEVPFDASTLTWQIGDSLGSYNDAGTTLYHSFQRFSVPVAQTAEFSASLATPEQVIARVTGGAQSLIDGTIRSTISGADLYLLNPSGVLFRQGAALDVTGSFYVSSADVMRDAGGVVVLETGSLAPPLLAVDAPVSFGFLAPEPASIDFRQVAGLSVPEGETFAAVGGDVTMLGQGLNSFDAPGARLAFVAGGPGVDVPVDPAGFDLARLPPDAALGEVDLSGGTRIFVSGETPDGESGSIFIRGGSFVLGGSLLSAVHRADTDATSPAIDVEVTGEARIDSGSLMTTSAVAGGRGGDLRVAGGTLTIRGARLLGTSTTGAGRGGDAIFEGGAITVDGGSVLTTSSTGPGPGGDLVLAGGAVTLDGGALLLARASGAGAGGAVEVDAASLSLGGGARILSETLAGAPGGLVDLEADEILISDVGASATGSFVASRATGAGDGGGLRVVADAVLLRDGGQLLSETSGSGAAGTVRVAADRVQAEGRSQPAAGVARPSGIRVQTARGSTGDGGTLPSPVGPDGVLGLEVDARVLEVSDGAELGSFTEGLGRAGDVRIGLPAGEALHPSQRVTVRGGPAGFSDILSQARAQALDPVVGDGGRIEIRTGALELLDGGFVSASTTGTGRAGDVEIHADQARIAGADPVFGETRAGVNAKSLGEGLEEAGDAGAITMRIAGDLLLAEQGQIEVETTGGGEAGLIDLDLGGRLRMESGASISAEAGAQTTGAGGSIQVAAARGVRMLDSTINARSLGLGDAGSITLDAGPRLDAIRSSITSESVVSSGGQIGIVATEVVNLVDSQVTSSVALGGPEEDGGDIRIDPDLVLLNRSQILAQAFDGNGGNIFITAGAFVASQTSLVDATSQNGGIDGEIIIDSPQVDVSGQVVQLPQDTTDAAALLKSACGARTGELGSFVVMGYGGLPASPDGPLPTPTWLPAGAAGGAAWPSLSGEGDATAAVRIAGLDCPREMAEVIR